MTSRRTDEGIGNRGSCIVILLWHLMWVAGRHFLRRRLQQGARLTCFMFWSLNNPDPCGRSKPAVLGTCAPNEGKAPCCSAGCGGGGGGSDICCWPAACDVAPLPCCERWTAIAAVAACNRDMCSLSAVANSALRAASLYPLASAARSAHSLSTRADFVYERSCSYGSTILLPSLCDHGGCALGELGR